MINGRRIMRASRKTANPRCNPVPPRLFHMTGWKRRRIPVANVVQEPWGQTTAYVTDLNGFLVEICSPVGSGAV
ncbi:MAG: hypothetical protein KDH19_10850 [Geminicoccaceae bacterium]|nr:hypothetical protein [Geminicoccaceae bacterium]MCB2011841.1 hypothetical protein [Geminicoccaceae bacterium]